VQPARQRGLVAPGRARRGLRLGSLREPALRPFRHSVSSSQSSPSSPSSTTSAST